MNKNQKIIIIFLLIGLLIVLSACDNNSGGSPAAEEIGQGLKIDIKRNTQSLLLKDQLQLQSLADELGPITEARVSVDGVTQIGGAADSFVFGQLKQGLSHTVTVSLFGMLDGVEKELYQGQQQITVEKGVLTEAVVEVYPLNAESLVVNIYDEEGLPVAADLISKVELYHPTLTAAEYSAVSTYNENKIIFNNSSALQLIASYWHLKLVPAESKVESDHLEFLFLPGEEKELNLVLSNGGSELSLKKITGPEPVNSLSLSGSELSWVWDGAVAEEMDYFVVLYAENYPLAEAEYLTPISDKIAYNLGSSSYSYQIENLKSGHYLVRAYNQDGYGSRHTALAY